MSKEHLWLELTVNDFCGLCGNFGLVVIGGRATPDGHYLEAATVPCICPNGRAHKRQQEQKKVRQSRTDCPNCAQPIIDHCKVHLIPCCPGKCEGL